MGIQVTDLHLLRDQLLLRRHKLQTATAHSHAGVREPGRAETANLLLLLEQVDKALERVEAGSYGICEICQGELEAQRLLADPQARVCLDCLRPEEARALERDLELAARIQNGLVPETILTLFSALTNPAASTLPTYSPLAIPMKRNSPLSFVLSTCA